MAAVNATVLQKADQWHADVLSLRTALNGVQDAVKEKAEVSTVERLNSQFRNINQALTQKAEFTEIEVLKSQLKVLGIPMEQKPWEAPIDALSMMLKGFIGGLGSTIDERVEKRMKETSTVTIATSTVASG
eukprot:gnl/MRDRNA2_/MRDRNA2_152207_c0_seq1.p1 gnl/MRDRNA2_/MRDRNA2_152207_c0~~gnl/MRDRNA2_/MRDRNA2_152207_c0_seq1.p1  ORF type:complete len:131 (+),score=33.03 gnl/MRDRNA2_/MRDRNA2_152207_c0_seq1:145-537(+)